jgi:hypothetical protein
MASCPMEDTPAAMSTSSCSSSRFLPSGNCHFWRLSLDYLPIQSVTSDGPVMP